jgi:hypothetical protein
LATRVRSRSGAAGRALPVPVALLVATIGLAGCGFGANVSPASLPAPSVGPAVQVSGAVAQTRGLIASALASVSSVAIQFADASRPYRPPESSRLRNAPRAVYQVSVPDRPDSGYIVVYEFADAAAAVDAGNEEAGYLGTGPARVNFPRDAQHVLRQVGPTLILYSWSPSDTTDRTLEVTAAVLTMLGIGFSVPN